MDKKKLGAALKALDKKERVCDVCGEGFVGSGNALYCSQKCKYKARRAREKDKDGK